MQIPGRVYLATDGLNSFYGFSQHQAESIDNSESPLPEPAIDFQ